MLEFQIPDMQVFVQIEGNHITLLGPGPDGPKSVVQEHDTTYDIDCPWYEGLEGFAAYAGDDFRVAAAQLGHGDRIVYLYDHRQAFYPLIKDARDGKRRSLKQERKDEPGLFTAEGAALEWQQGGNFGYAWNLDCSYCSEWGSAPFPDTGETVEQMNTRITDGINSFVEAVGGVDFVYHVVGGEVTRASYRD